MIAGNLIAHTVEAAVMVCSSLPSPPLAHCFSGARDLLPTCRIPQASLTTDLLGRNHFNMLGKFICHEGHCPKTRDLLAVQPERLLSHTWEQVWISAYLWQIGQVVEILVASVKTFTERQRGAGLVVRAQDWEKGGAGL